MRHKLSLTALLAAASAAGLLASAASASASASVRVCSYRNLTHGAVPYVAQVRTNLTSAAVGGANVCAVVSDLVRRVQRRGFDPGHVRQLAGAGESWALAHRLIYPRGWPQPQGPAQDPHMHVTLHMLAQTRRSRPARARPAGASRYWIKLNEYT
jgi:hypothetical protein